MKLESKPSVLTVSGNPSAVSRVVDAKSNAHAPAFPVRHVVEGMCKQLFLQSSTFNKELLDRVASLEMQLEKYTGANIDANSNVTGKQKEDRDVRNAILSPPAEPTAAISPYNAMRESTSSSSTSPRRDIRTTYHVAIALGCHIDPSILHLDPIQSEERRRCWAGLRMLYTIQTTALGNTESFWTCKNTVRLPADVNDTEITLTDIQTPLPGPTQMSYLLFKFQLYDLASAICRETFTSSIPSERTIKDLDTQICDVQELWDKRYALHSARGPLPTHHVVHLHILYGYSHQLFLLLHRPFFAQSLLGFNLDVPNDSQIRCLASAEALLDIHRTLVETPANRPAMPSPNRTPMEAVREQEWDSNRLKGFATKLQAEQWLGPDSMDWNGWGDLMTDVMYYDQRDDYDLRFWETKMPSGFSDRISIWKEKLGARREN
ncbi:C6 zinc finger domain-containing protein [Botrytis cinerea]